MAFERGYFLSALAGLAAGVMLVSVLPSAAKGGAAQTDMPASEEIGPRATYSGCLIGGQLLKVRSRDRDPGRCDSLTTPAGRAPRYVTWNAAGTRGPVGPMGPEGPQGPQGDQGPAGTDGVDGTDGADGVSGYERVSQSVTLGGIGTAADVFLDCPAGKVVLGGWHLSASSVKRIDVYRSAPMDDDSWWFTYSVLGGTGEQATFHVTCVYG